VKFTWFNLMPCLNIMAAALARRTSKAVLVVLGNSIALYNPLIRVAEEFAMLDVISSGRLQATQTAGRNQHRKIHPLLRIQMPRQNETMGSTSTISIIAVCTSTLASRVAPHRGGKNARTHEHVVRG